MALMIYEIVSKAKLMGVDVNNRWHLIDPDGTHDPLAMCALFKTQVLDALKAGVNSGLVWSNLTYARVYPDMTLQHDYTTAFPVAGTDGNAPAPSFVAGTVKWALGDTQHAPGDDLTKHIKRGGKRIGGLADVDTAANQWLAGAAKTAISTGVGNFYGGGMGGLLACVVHFPPSPAPIPPAKTSPRLPVVRWAPITGHSLKGSLGSQVSRKQGHGQ